MVTHPSRRFTVDNSVCEDELYGSFQSDRIGGIEKMETIRKAVHMILFPFLRFPYEGFTRNDQSGRFLNFSHVLALYRRDISDVKDFFSIKYGNITERPCHACDVLSDKLIGVPTSSLRHIRQLRRVFLLEDINEEIKAIVEKFARPGQRPGEE